MRANDGLPEDRVLCMHCRHYDSGSYRCRFYKRAELADVPLRCVGFFPLPHVADQRPGRERWPTLKQDIEELRALEQGVRP